MPGRFHPLHHQYSGTTTHIRGVQVQRSFSYPLNQGYVDVESNNHHWWGGLYREDHFGDPATLLGETVRNKVREETNIFPTGAIDFMGNLRTYGYSFNPICLFFVWAGEGERDQLAFIVSEVTNTPWGQTRVHVLDVRNGAGDTPILREKSLHVSPFNQVPDGRQLWKYTFHSVPPSTRIHVSVILVSLPDRNPRPLTCCFGCVPLTHTWVPADANETAVLFGRWKGPRS